MKDYKKNCAPHYPIRISQQIPAHVSSSSKIQLTNSSSFVQGNGSTLLLPSVGILDGAIQTHRPNSALSQPQSSSQHQHQPLHQVQTGPRRHSKYTGLPPSGKQQDHQRNHTHHHQEEHDGFHSDEERFEDDLQHHHHHSHGHAHDHSDSGGSDEEELFHRHESSIFTPRLPYSASTASALEGSTTLLSPPKSKSVTVLPVATNASSHPKQQSSQHAHSALSFASANDPRGRSPSPPINPKPITTVTPSAALSPNTKGALVHGFGTTSAMKLGKERPIEDDQDNVVMATTLKGEPFAIPTIPAIQDIFHRSTSVQTSIPIKPASAVLYTIYNDKPTKKAPVSNNPYHLHNPKSVHHHHQDTSALPTATGGTASKSTLTRPMSAQPHHMKSQTLNTNKSSSAELKQPQQATNNNNNQDVTNQRNSNRKYSLSNTDTAQPQPSAVVTGPSMMSTMNRPSTAAPTSSTAQPQQQQQHRRPMSASAVPSSSRLAHSNTVDSIPVRQAMKGFTDSYMTINTTFQGGTSPSGMMMSPSDFGMMRISSNDALNTTSMMTTGTTGALVKMTHDPSSKELFHGSVGKVRYVSNGARPQSALAKIKAEAAAANALNHVASVSMDEELIPGFRNRKVAF
jgi:hypothetical protein